MTTPGFARIDRSFWIWRRGGSAFTPEPFAPSASGVTFELQYGNGRKRKEVIDITDSQIVVRLPAARLPRVQVG